MNKENLVKNVNAILSKLDKFNNISFNIEDIEEFDLQKFNELYTCYNNLNDSTLDNNSFAKTNGLNYSSFQVLIFYIQSLINLFQEIKLKYIECLDEVIERILLFSVTTYDAKKNKTLPYNLIDFILYEYIIVSKDFFNDIIIYLQDEIHFNPQLLFIALDYNSCIKNYFFDIDLSLLYNNKVNTNIWIDYLEHSLIKDPFVDFLLEDANNAKAD